MKKYIIILLSLSFITITAQQKLFVAETGADYLMPVGGFAERFDPAVGFSVYAGAKVSNIMTWLGKFEYYKFDSINKKSLSKEVHTDIEGLDPILKLPMPDLEMSFTAAGLSAEGRMNLISSRIIESNLSFSFGFIYWENKRSEYYDSLYVHSSKDESPILVDILEVPEQTQMDWSGVASAGINLSFAVFKPVYINFGANYKLIVGELWPALSLGLENVSGITIIDLRAGILIKL